MAEIGAYDFKAVEEEILDFWNKNKTYETAKKQVKGKKYFYFLDGPPFTSGRAHIGHAWNHALKDSVLRFKRMTGHDVWDRAGYDMHGLPTEHATEKVLGIHGKEEIEKLGTDKFVEECRKISIKNMLQMNEDFKRIGTWMDFENAYKPIDPEFIEGEWWLVKKAHEKGRLYEGLRTITWCAEDGTALSKHELEYQTVTDESIYLKFPIVGSNNEFLIVWTTTPWTIPYNLAVMVNPDIDYLKVKVDNEKWIIAEALTAFIPAVAEKKFEVLEKIRGEKLEGIKYVHPFRNEISAFKEIEKNSPKLHSVLLSKEFVDTSGGSGLVHCAPGCGPEDYEVGHRNGLPAFNELDEQGKFKSSMGKFAGLKAKKDDKKFIDFLEKAGALIATSPVEHEYAHCGRCHNPVVFRTTKQWFFKIEDLKETMRELNKDIYWVPGYAGSRQFDAWLDNLRDNSITRQRYWGTPVPIWKCECGNYDVIGSRKELKQKTGKLPEDLHAPSLKNLTIKCSKCKKEMHRIPDVLDVWIDSATASWNCLNYPRDEKLFKKMFPADFILEGIDQVRGWFNILFVASMIALEKPAYKAVYMHGFINDAQGRKMSKSLKNYILPGEVIEKYGADTLRYYTIGGTSPGVDLAYNFEDMKVSFRNLGVLWNLHKFMIDYAKIIGKNPTTIKKPKLNMEEKYILSKLNSAVKEITKAFEEYRLNEIPHMIENLFLELSRTYIQLVREKSSVGSDAEKEAVLYTIYKVMSETVTMFAPICPFIAEKMYQNMKTAFGLKEESVHLLDWPSAKDSEIDKTLEINVVHAKSAMQAILSSREKLKRGVRWPVLEAVLVSNKDEVRQALIETSDLIASQTNVKKITVSDEFKDAKKSYKPDFAKIGPKFGGKSAQILAKFVTTPSLAKDIETSGRTIITLEKEKIELNRDYFIIETSLPDNWVSSEFPNGAIYLNSDSNKELESEGFAREMMRLIQSERKEAGLQRNDVIELFLDPMMKEELSKFESAIKEKCGVKSIKYSGSGEKKAVLSVRGKEAKLSFNLIK